MKLNIVHKRNLYRHFKPASSLPHNVLSSGKVGCIESIRFVDHDTLLLRVGDKRQRRRIRRKMKLANAAHEPRALASRAPCSCSMGGDA